MTFPPLLDSGKLLLPIHIVLLELIVHPISAFAFENLPSTDGEMRQSLLPVKRLVRSVAAGVIVSLVALGIFGFYRLGGDIIRARSYAMMAVPAGNILFGFSPLSKVLHLGIS